MFADLEHASYEFKELRRQASFVGNLLARIRAWWRAGTGHIRVGREWMPAAEYRRRYLVGEK
ncbi:MAG: hypothetical protein WAX33_04350 [Rectinemataceae bacterium]